MKEGGFEGGLKEGGFEGGLKEGGFEGSGFERVDLKRGWV